MARHQRELTGDLDALVAHLDRAITSSSATAAFEDGSDVTIGDARMVVRAYERYSTFGGNRVSLTFSVLGVGDHLAVTAITAGGSEAMFFKLNRVGEDAFLTKAIDALDSFGGRPPAPEFPDGARI